MKRPLGCCVPCLVKGVVAETFDPGLNRPPRIALYGASGWLGQFLGPAMLDQGLVRPQDLTCLNRSGPSAHYARWPAVRWDTGSARGGAAGEALDLSILSVRPEDFRAADFDCSGHVVLSLMAGISCAEIAQRTQARVVVRTMINAAVETQRSYSPWYANGPLSETEQSLITAVLCSVGSTDILPDEQALEALSALSGTGPAFVALLASALQKAGQGAGLPPAIAERAAEAIVCDAASLLDGKIDQAEAIISRLLSYQGTTAAALKSVRDGGFDRLIAQAVLQGAARARQMAED